ncbi:SLC13 family permease [Rossellomorea sp. NS-SX7]|uniref:SLC13 family permease n=1 Tax=Rossellomorea sp. NS-SX7 TaxID=3463856 RepID=UPI004057F82C
MKKQLLLVISIFLYGLFFSPLFDWDEKWKAIAALIIIQVLWIGKVFPLAFSSLLLILLLSFHFFSYEQTLSYFSSGIVWLLFSTFIISTAFINTGLAGRVSLYMLKLSRGSGKALIFISFLLMVVLSVLIPSNVGKGSLLSSVLDSLMKSLRKIGDVGYLGKSLFIGVAYLAAISGAFVATGASSTIYAFGIMSEVSPTLNYLKWFELFGIPVFLFIVILWGIFLIVFPPEKIDRKLLLTLIEGKIDELGPVSINEKKIMCIIAGTLILWIAQPVHGYSIPQVGLMGACFTVFPFVGVWDWDEARKSIDWDLMLFFASTLMVSGMLIRTDTIDWMAAGLNGILSGHPPWVVILVLIICTSVIRVVFVNILGFLTIMLPLSVTIGHTIPDLSPMHIAMPVFLACVPGFFLVTQSPVHLISFSYGYFTDKDLLRVGLVASIAWITVILCSVFLYW